MTSALVNKISRMYTLALEDVCVRILYFFNTINTYYLVAGICTYFFVDNRPIDWSIFAIILIAGTVLIRISDFHPLFLIPTIPAMFIVVAITDGALTPFLKIVLVNFIVYVVVLVFFMGIPESIVARDPVRVIPRKLWNVVITVAPTTVSLSMSLFFSTFMSFLLYFRPGFNNVDRLSGVIFWGCFIAGSIMAYIFRPRTYVSKFMKPPVEKAYFKRVIVLNIDGCRLDIFNDEILPNIQEAIKHGTSFPNGLTTVYRALTNPAFASILSGTTPDIHGVKDNNLGQKIKVECLPDIVPTILYGSMHVQHFSKKHWKTHIVSLPRHSVYKSDAIVQMQLFDDLLHENDKRLFIMDYSEADFLAHAYGSKSIEYRQALHNIDIKIGEVFSFLKNNSMEDDTAVIICSDHGVVAIDHSYMLFDAEKYVPFIAVGNGIRKGLTIDGEASIMDICANVAYLLGVRYPSSSKGRVFVEMLADGDAEGIKERVVSDINKAYYAAVAEEYDEKHPEVLEGDMDWWVQQFRRISVNGGKALSVLDFGSGTGLVGRACIEAGFDIERFVCYDISESMIDEARRALGDDKFSYISDINMLEGCKFDVICVNSVLHHVHDVRRCTDLLISMLKDDGFLLGGHEPNRAFFNSRVISALAKLYKMIGGGFSIPSDVVMEINENLSKHEPRYPSITNVEILQTVENHSPVEQSIYGIDREKGFDANVLGKDLFKGLHARLIETYTTAFIRRQFRRIPLFRKLGEFVFYRVFGSGNLIRYVFQKT